MDVGTGGMVLLSGITSRIFKEQSKSLGFRIFNAVKTMPIIISIAVIGILTRYISNHPEVVDEYGVHWNFFWTVWIINIFSSFIQRPKYALIFGFLLISAYQIFLQNGGAKYILLAERVDLISKNREGIFGSLGYFSIFLIGIGISSFIFEREKCQMSGFNINRRWKIIWKSAVVTGSFYIMCVLAELYIMPISRRMANFTYIMYMTYITICYNTVCYIADSMLKERQFNYVVHLICTNQMGFFLMCNLIVGVYNISFLTTFHPNVIAFPVLTIYFTFALMLTWGLKYLGVKIR